MRRWTIGIPKVLVVKSIVPLSKLLLLHSAQGPKIQPAPDGRWPPFGDGFFPNSLTATKLFEIQAGSLQKCARTFVVARISKFGKEIPSFEASPVFLYSKSSAYSQLVLVIERFACMASMRLPLRPTTAVPQLADHAPYLRYPIHY